MSRFNTLENLALEDIITVGKHRGKTVETTYKEDSGYLVWFREERRVKNDQTNLFNKEVNVLLDMTINESKSLRRKYKTWAELGLLDAVETVEQPKPEPVVEPAVAYEVWGAF